MSVFVGIDQTGAVNPRGVPRPLPACRMEGSRFEFAALKEFSKSEITAFAGRDSGVLILDCVLGLPKELNLSFREALTLLQPESRFGRQAAEEFFARIGRDRIWHREVEKLAKANSLFRSRPYQKNIQTGTYRFWLEMSRDAKWFSVPWLPDERKRKFRIFEGYPSLLWRRLVGTVNRKPLELPELTRKIFGLRWSSPQIRWVEKDPNFADALILALAGAKLLRETKSPTPDPEGWILGVNPLNR